LRTVKWDECQCKVYRFSPPVSRRLWLGAGWGD
jgi:hypothetical protein